jgi:surfeit locus 1 family protein
MDYRVNERIKFWLITLGTLVAIGITVSLGRWQLSRAAEKEAMHASIEERGQQAVLAGTTLLGSMPADELVHRRISVKGRWLADQIVFLDNRVMNGQTGFYVVTPLQIEGSRLAVLVQRGWVPRNFAERTLLPKVDSPAGVVEVSGRVAPPPTKLLEMGRPEAGVIRQNLDLAQFSAEIQLPMAEVSILQTGDPGDGLLRDWPPVNMGVEKNYGYAFQWFGLSALVAILYVWFQIVRRFIARKKA